MAGVWHRHHRVVTDAEQACPRCADPGPPHTVTVPLNPDAPTWDVWTITLWQCRVCHHRYSRAAVTAARIRKWAGPPFTPSRPVVTRHAPRYL